MINVQLRSLLIVALWHPGSVLATPASHSEADFLGDIPVVLTSSRIGLSPLEAPAPVTVIDRATIRASGFTEIQDIFRLVPGFLVSDTPTGSPFVVNHGMGDPWSRRLLVLIDGSSVFDPLQGGVNWDDLPLRLDDIERIEVVRSPNPSSYGANAFQGVINIITRAVYAGPSSGITLRAGQPDITDLYATLGRGDADMNWRVSLSRREAANFRASAQPAGSQYDESIQRDALNSHLTWRPSTDQEVRLQLGLSQGRDETVGIRSEGTPKTRTRFLQAAWNKQYANESEIRVQYFHYARTFDLTEHYPDMPLLPGIPFSLDKSTSVRRDDLEIQQTHTWSDDLKTALGAGYRIDKGKSDGVLFGVDWFKGRQWQLFGSLDWQATRQWTLHAGAMLEDHYNTDTLFSPRLAANYAITPNQGLRFVVGKGYRAPTIFEVTAREADVVKGEPPGNVPGDVPGDGIDESAYHDLEPESVEYFDFGYVAQLPSLGMHIDARIFRNRLSHFIDEQSCTVEPEWPGGAEALLGTVCPFVVPILDLQAPRRDSYQAYYFFNSGTLDVRGADLSVNWKSPDWGDFRLTHAWTRIAASHMIIDSRIAADGISKDRDFEASAPHRSASLLWSRVLPWWGLSTNLGYYHVGKMKWPNGGAEQPAFDRLDIKLVKSFGKPSQRNEVALTVQNLNNEHVEFRNHLIERRAFMSLSLSW